MTHTTHPPLAKQLPRLLALWIVLAAFGLTAAASRSPFERLPHLEDEMTYLFQARILAGGNWVIPSPEPSSPFWQPFILDRDDVRFGKYSPGWPLLLSFGVRLGAAWWVNSALAALAVALVYRLGSRLFDPASGLIAAALTATSPMFLLLGGSLMGHTAALFWGVLFAFGLERLWRRRAAWWAVVAGAALGMLVNTRPLTAIGIALPFGVAIGLLLLRELRASSLKASLLRLALLVLAAGGVSLLTPLYSDAATGDPATNLYTLVWSYDRVGFCDECGRSGHDIHKALRNLQLDLPIWAADSFGWTAPGSPFSQVSLQWWRWGRGLSWILLPAGLWFGRRNGWTWLLLGTVVGLVGVHMFYWIGQQIYSARYYSEALPGLALVSAVGVTGLARKINRPLIYALFALLIAASLLGYTPDRLRFLWHFNGVGRDKIAALEAQRDGRPALILVTGDERRSWRDWGTYMALTSPYLDSDVIAARVHDDDETAAVLARFPGRQVFTLPRDNTLRPAD